MTGEPLAGDPLGGEPLAGETALTQRHKGHEEHEEDITTLFVSAHLAEAGY